MKYEESLSDKMYFNTILQCESYKVKDVKKAVKKLKEEIENPTYPYADVIQLIDKIFGEKLTK